LATTRSVCTVQVSRRNALAPSSVLIPASRNCPRRCHQRNLLCAAGGGGVDQAINAQQHSRHRPARTSPPVRPPLVPFRHQPGSLQRFLHPRVAQPRCSSAQV
jgi:hypothetical protein